jgi:hypothetical protein
VPPASTRRPLAEISFRMTSTGLPIAIASRQHRRQRPNQTQTVARRSGWEPYIELTRVAVTLWYCVSCTVARCNAGVLRPTFCVGGTG